MRRERFVGILLLIAGCHAPGMQSRNAKSAGQLSPSTPNRAAELKPTTAPPPSRGDLSIARALDDLGVRAYIDGRYNDAIVYFQEALRLGGPPSQQWNIARCYQKLDEPERARDALERYLLMPGLTVEERREATAEVEEIQHRPSPLTVMSTPSAVTLVLDGKRIDHPNRSPIVIRLAPGKHTLVAEAVGHQSTSKEIEAKYGRAVVLNIELVPTTREFVHAPSSSSARRP